MSLILFLNVFFFFFATIFTFNSSPGFLTVRLGLRTRHFHPLNLSSSKYHAINANTISERKILPPEIVTLKSTECFKSAVNAHLIVTWIFILFYILLASTTLLANTALTSYRRCRCRLGRKGVHIEGSVSTKLKRGTKTTVTSKYPCCWRSNDLQISKMCPKNAEEDPKMSALRCFHLRICRKIGGKVKL